MTSSAWVNNKGRYSRPKSTKVFLSALEGLEWLGESERLDEDEDEDDETESSSVIRA